MEKIKKKSNKIEKIKHIDQTKTTPVRRAVILAAGKGKRIQHLTVDIPKCLIEVNGK